MHPVSFDYDYAIERDRLTVFFRLLLAIPWLILLYLYQLVAWIAAMVAWFAMLFTKRYPESLYDFVAGYIRYAGRVAAWGALAVDETPPFSGERDDSRAVRVDVGSRQAEYSRAKTFFKILLSFPQQVIGYGLGFLVGGAAMITWVRVLFTGRQSATMNDALRIGLPYTLRMQAFLLLLTETHPRLLDVPEQGYPADAPALPPAPPAAPAPVTPAEGGP